jgi:hypothetical protein
MADNITITQGSGTTIATDDVSGVQYQVVKISAGADGVAGSLVDWTTGTAGSPAGGVQSVQGVSGGTPAPVTSVGYDVSTTFTAATTAIDAGDVLGASAAALTFTAVGPSAGSIVITGVQYLIPLNAIPANMTSFRLHLYNVTPPSALASGAAWDLATGDQASYLGFIDLGSPVDMGTTLYCEANGINKQVRLSSANIFGYLVSNGGSWTPTAIIHKITLHTFAV